MGEPIVPFDVLNKLIDLRTRQFGQSTCFDYVDSLTKEGTRCGVTVFIEPLGNVTKFADSWIEAIDWWIAVLERQPFGWGYVLAGSHLMVLQDENRLPDNPEEVWKLRSDGVNYGKILLGV